MRFFTPLLICLLIRFATPPSVVWLQKFDEQMTASAKAEAAAEVISTEEAIAAYKDGVLSSPNFAVFVADVRPGLADGLIEVEVTSRFLSESKEIREGMAEALWKTWAYNSVPHGADVDRARIRLVDGHGKQVGGSGAIAGSVLYVDD